MLGKTGGSGGWGAVAGGRWVAGALVVWGGRGRWWWAGLGAVAPPPGEFFLKLRALINYSLRNWLPRAEKRCITFLLYRCCTGISHGA